MLRPTARALRGVASLIVVLGATTAPLWSQATRVASRPMLKLSAGLVLPDKTIRPLRAFEFQLVSTSDTTQTIAVRTNGDGTVSMPVARGNYQLRSVAPATLNDSSYRWSVPVFMSWNGASVQISNKNAIVTAAKPAAVQAAQQVAAAAPAKVTTATATATTTTTAAAPTPAPAPAKATTTAATTTAAPTTPAPTTAPATAPIVKQAGSPRDTAVADAPMPSLTRPVRHGVWFNFGLGAGSLGCQGCNNSRITGGSGALAIGVSLGQHLQLGAQSVGFLTQQNGVTVDVGTVNGLLRFYPLAGGRFFVQGGGGVGTVSYNDGTGLVSASGAAAILGMGYDIRLTRNVNLTPFWDAYAVRIYGSTLNVGQLGLGITVR